MKNLAFLFISIFVSMCFVNCSKSNNNTVSDSITVDSVDTIVAGTVIADSL